MASRTKQKEEARARRLAEEQARAAKAARQRRLQMLGGVVLAAIAVVAVAIAISSGGGNSGIKKGAAAQKDVAAVSTLLNGIPQTGNVLGNPKAPVTMTYFGDLECPICQDFTLRGGFPQLVQNEVRQGKVKVVYDAFETATRDPSTFTTQQAAALAAGAQKKFWDYTELFYRQQGTEGTGYVTESYLDTLARQVPGLNFNTWKTARSNQTYASQVTAQEASGNHQGIIGTPTLIFTGPKGEAVPKSSVPPYSDLQQAVNKVS